MKIGGKKYDWKYQMLTGVLQKHMRFIMMSLQ